MSISPPTRMNGAVIEAWMDDILEDLELLFQEQLTVLEEDATEQNALRKGKAVMIDHNPTEPHQQQDYPAIMVLEESASSPSIRPVELITPQPGGGSRWFVQRMPHTSSTASGSSPINQPKDYYQSSTLPASTSENTEEESLTVTVGSTAVTTLAVEAEGPGQSADLEAIRAEVAHRGYKNTRVSVTILKRH